ncbi:MAG: hypothetical protein AMK75_00610 [Planctomycetes bacterium SM23_65]|nr:MAG: hypothetical protein AMK75_00610 [Planctomycetes bacterium SM23_65]
MWRKPPKEALRRSNQTWTALETWGWSVILQDDIAPGALRAAKFLLNQNPGLHSMLDVLGL